MYTTSGKKDVSSITQALFKCSIYVLYVRNESVESNNIKA